MTAIVPFNIKTKKQLKEKLTAGETLELADPTPFGTRIVVLNQRVNETVSHTLDDKPLKPGYRLTCTNHPKRSWFAEIEIKTDNTLRVS